LADPFFELVKDSHLWHLRNGIITTY
jgi:hypothetical protein